MPAAFAKPTFTPFIARTRRLVARVERDPSRFKPTDFDAVRDGMIAWALENNQRLFDDFVKKEVLTRSDTVPAIFGAIKQRSDQEWASRVRKAFFIADAAFDRPSQGGFLARLRKAVRRFTGRSTVEDRGGTFRLGSKSYYVSKALRIAATKAARRVPVSTMEHFIRSGSERLGGSGHEAVVAIGPDKVLLDGHAAIATAIEQGSKYVPVRFVNTSDLIQAEVKVLAIASPRGGRVRTLRIVPYLQLLFRTLPQQLERDLIRWNIRFFEDRPWFRVFGGVVENSAHTCEWSNGRVFDESGLDYISKSRQLRDHLFHPNCRHRIVRVPASYRGTAWSASDIAGRVRNGRIQ